MSVASSISLPLWGRACTGTTSVNGSFLLPDGAVTVEHSTRGDWVLEEACGGAMSALTPFTVLVVEDETLIRFWMAEVLMEAGFQVIQASSADEALRVLQSAVEVDLLLTDIRMPGSLDGLELANRVRATWPTLKIVILSSEHPPATDDAGADAFISKPFHPVNVVNRLKQLMGVQNDKP